MLPARAVLAGLSFICALPLTTVEASDKQHGIESQLAQWRQTHRLTSFSGTGRRTLTGPEAFLRAHVKYGHKPSEEMAIAANVAAKAAIAVAATTPSKGAGVGTGVAGPHDGEFLFPITMGKSPMNAVFDSGSSDLWGFSTLTPTAQRTTHKLYNVSTGTKVAGETFDITYGTGCVIYYDKIVAASVTTSAAMGAATNIAPFIVNDRLDAFVGFAFENLNDCSPTQCFTFFDLIGNSLPKPLFAAALRHNGPGTWDLGFIDTAQYTGSLVTTEQFNYPGAGYWGIYVQGYSTGSTARIKSPFYAVVDTGTSVVLVPQAVVTAYYTPVTGAAYDKTRGGVVFTCSSASKILPLNFFINGEQRIMPAAYGVYAQYNTTHCDGAVQSGAAGSNLLGLAFLKSQYVVFNPAVNTVSFAPLVNATT